MAKCELCDKPAGRLVNVNQDAASSVPSDFRPRCDEHGPAWPLVIVDADRPFVNIVTAPAGEPAATGAWIAPPF